MLRTDSDAGFHCRRARQRRGLAGFGELSAISMPSSRPTMPFSPARVYTLLYYYYTVLFLLSTGACPEVNPNRTPNSFSGEVCRLAGTASQPPGLLEPVIPRKRGSRHADSAHARSATVIPAEAGIQAPRMPWMPASAGMTTASFLPPSRRRSHRSSLAASLILASV